VAEHGYRIGVLGATGQLGRELLLALAESELPIESCLAFASEDGVGQSIALASNALVARALDESAWAEMDLLLSAVSGEALVRHVGRAGGFSGLVLDVTGGCSDDVLWPLIDVDIGHPPPAGRETQGPILGTVPRWAATQVTRILRPVVAVRDVTRVLVTGAPESPETEFDEQHVATQVRQLIGRKLALGYFGAPIPADQVGIQLEAEVRTDEGLLAQTAHDTLINATGVSLRLGVDASDPELRCAARRSGDVLVTRIREDTSDLGCVHFSWTAATLKRGAALQTIKLIRRLAAAGIINRA
jgi:aspartate-semialdehyde dehydrogenase